MGREVIEQALGSVPNSPGVYIMKDSRGKVLYVGKAKRLRARLGSYARPAAAPPWYATKIEAMTSRVAAVEVVLTSSEKEALILESNLIKAHRPPYNIELRDDKSYPYFRLDLSERFPRFMLVRRPRFGDGARYFGPYENVGAARRTMRLLQRIFPLRRCSDHVMRNRSRPCLDYDTGRCLGPCAGKVDEASYMRVARELVAFLEGKGSGLVKELERQMWQAAEEMAYERAAVLRDRLMALKRTLEQQLVSTPGGGRMDVVGVSVGEWGAAAAVLKVIGGEVVGTRRVELGVVEPAEGLGQLLVGMYSAHDPPPPLVLLSQEPAQKEAVEELLGELAGRKVRLVVPRRGQKRRLVELAVMNAGVVPEEEPAQKALAQIAKWVGVEEIRHMECLDISHIGGAFSVGSISAFVDGRPHKGLYRRYKLASTPPGDDYAAIAEVLSRRLDGRRPPPDLLVIDGGKGQLNVAVRVIGGAPAHARPLAVMAIAKEPSAADKLYLPGRKNPLGVRGHEPGLRLIMHLRDEAHRFGLAYHRLLRAKRLRRSVLEEIPGVGPAKARAMIRALGSLRAIASASAEQLAAAGIDMPTARRVVAFFRAMEEASGQ